MQHAAHRGPLPRAGRHPGPPHVLGALRDLRQRAARHPPRRRDLGPSACAASALGRRARLVGRLPGVAHDVHRAVDPGPRVVAGDVDDVAHGGAAVGMAQPAPRSDSQHSAVLPAPSRADMVHGSTGVRAGAQHDVHRRGAT
eukprot:4174191-Heterocapsa_arctica.AAC.1